MANYTQMWKNGKNLKSIHLEENLQSKTRQVDLPFLESVRLVIEEMKKERKQKLDDVKRKILNKASQSIDKDSGVLKDTTEVMKQSVDGRKWPEMEKSKKERLGNFMGNSDFEGEPKKISHIVKITKNRRKEQKSKELVCNCKESEFIAISNKSDGEHLPVIVDKINVNEPISNERACLPKSRIVDSSSNFSDNYQPVLVTIILNYLKFFPSISLGKKNKPIKSEVKSNTEAGTRTVTENSSAEETKVQMDDRVSVETGELSDTSRVDFREKKTFQY
ncbi:hypothetical protein AVEN_15226-1 [Araneus ventricosus]|uniref:Uncharacterized protein n=1 Tax=Araneus ventricosus TaxID=182803 RepID=A0A4Y2RUX4_ARAVE|nr:hypothetical protein AVEN_15226-1 [Araneus ventricosus]